MFGLMFVDVEFMLVKIGEFFDVGEFDVVIFFFGKFVLVIM